MNFIGDPHVNTIDNGRYTCHIQGLYVFAQTTTSANTTAYANLNNVNASGDNLIYPDDLFYIHVRSREIAPALSYVQRQEGFASVFSSYTISAVNHVFMISNENNTFGKINYPKIL